MSDAVRVARVALTANLERHLSCPVQTVPGDTVRGVLEAAEVLTLPSSPRKT